MKGIIVLNAFGGPTESRHFAERLKEELNVLGVFTEIVSDGYLKTAIEGDNIKEYINCDFAVFLDKDKYLSACLENSGIRLFNSHAAIRVCDDKGETYIALAKNGIKVPDTIFAPLCYREENPINSDGLKQIAKRLNYPLIVKESYGSKGSGVYLAEDFNKLCEIENKIKLKPHLYQKYISFRRGTDVRAIVIGGKFLCAMIRENKNDFRSNVALGGEGKAFDPPENFIAVAEKCAKVLNLDYCGVDLLFTESDPVVCEVNSNAFIGGIEKATGVNVAKEYAIHIIKTLKTVKICLK